MDPILYTVVDGGSNDMYRQRIIANNLANLNTPGFQGDLYQAQLLYMDNANTEGQTPNIQTFLVEEQSTVDTSAGALQTTGRPLDVAIKGDGYLAVQSVTGQQVYTRNGSLQINANGQLTLPSGQLVIGDGGPISIPPAKSIEIGSDGTISVVPLGSSSKELAVIGQLQIFALDPKTLAKTPDGFITSTTGAVQPADSNVQVVSGALESSNVNAISEMVNMINANRDFDVQMKFMSTVNDNEKNLAQILQE